MLRRNRLPVVAAVLVTALFAASPVQAATPEITQSSVWQSVLPWYDAFAVSFAGSAGEHKSDLSAVIGNAGPKITPDGFTSTASIEGRADDPSQQNTLNPEELPTEAGPKISPNG